MQGKMLAVMEQIKELQRESGFKGSRTQELRVTRCELFFNITEQKIWNIYFDVIHFSLVSLKFICVVLFSIHAGNVDVIII